MNILLCGACGKMGRMVAELAAAHGDVVVCGVDISPAPMPFPVVPSLTEACDGAEVLIDFSSPAALSDVLSYATAHRLPVLLAATGYGAEDQTKIEEAARRVPVFRTGNLSLGVNVLQRLVKTAAQALGGFDAEIVERHHRDKKDAPSGTALMLADSVREGADRALTPVYGRAGMTGARSKQEIGIHAVRGGTIVGEHEVMFAGEDEIVTLSHSARSRKVFAAGALRAGAWLIGRPAGLYNMDDLLSEIL